MCFLLCFALFCFVLRCCSAAIFIPCTRSFFLICCCYCCCYCRRMPGQACDPAARRCAWTARRCAACRWCTATATAARASLWPWAARRTWWRCTWPPFWASMLPGPLLLLRDPRGRPSAMWSRSPPSHASNDAVHSCESERGCVLIFVTFDIRLSHSAAANCCKFVSDFEVRVFHKLNTLRLCTGTGRYYQSLCDGFFIII
jgi:hypothetical protein